jgi:hypothetical protein
VPLASLYAALRFAAVGERLIDRLRLDTETREAAPSWRRSISDWTDDGLAKAMRVGQRYGFASVAGPDASGRVVDLAVSFVLVKLLLPVRLYLSVALTPTLARRMSSRLARLLGGRTAARL